MSSWIALLSQIPPATIVLIFSTIVFIIKRDWKLTFLTLCGFSLIINLGYWQETLETLSLVLLSTAIVTGMGLPLGILCAQYEPLNRLLDPVLDFMQTIPTFVYLIPTLMLFGLGVTPGIISTVIFAMPVVIRMTRLGIVQVPGHLTEAADAFGSTRLQRLIYVEIPHAFPTIRAGISQCLMLSLSMVVIAAMVGADGLGKAVIQSLNTVNISKGFESGIVIVILSMLLNQVLSGKSRSEEAS